MPGPGDLHRGTGHHRGHQRQRRPARHRRSDVIAGLDGNDIIVGLGGGNDTLVGNLGNDLLLAGRGDDILLGDQPAPGGPSEPSSFDLCNGQQSTDLAVPDTCELEVSIEGDFVPPPES